jgi:hypothetical protein
MRKLERGTDFDDFWDSLGEEVQDALSELEPDGRSGLRTHDVPGLGKVDCWLDECSEGADRGGWVTYLTLHGVLGPDGEPVTLEGDIDDSQYFFEGRSTRL